MASTQERIAGREIDVNIRFLEDLVGPRSLTRVGFRFWDGTRWPEARTPEATLVLRHAGALRTMFGAGTEKALAEAYLRDDFDIEGNIESAFELADHLHDRGREGRRSALRHLRNLWRLPSAQVDDERFWSIRRLPRHSPESDRRAISFHYDVSNEFFRLWLDQAMVYSCAYFETPEVDLEAAQQAHVLGRGPRAGQMAADLHLSRALERIQSPARRVTVWIDYVFAIVLRQRATTHLRAIHHAHEKEILSANRG